MEGNRWESTLHDEVSVAGRREEMRAEEGEDEGQERGRDR
jgi:hypothetical protein